MKRWPSVWCRRSPSFSAISSPGVLAGSGSAFDQMVANGLVLAGTVDDVKRQMEEMYKAAPFEYPFLLSYFALQPKESFLEDMELFATKVMPAFA